MGFVIMSPKRNRFHPLGQYNRANNDGVLSCGFSSPFHYTARHNIGKCIKALMVLRPLLVSAVSAGIKPRAHVSFYRY